MDEKELALQLKEAGDGIREKAVKEVESKGYSTKSEVEVVAKELKEFKQKAEQEKEQLNEVISELKRNGSAGAGGKTIEVELKENKEKLNTILKGGSNEELEIKATVTRASIATNVHQLEIEGVGQLQRRARGLYAKLRKINVPVGTHKGAIAYTDWDEATAVKAAAMVAEGGTFPESTAAFKGYTLPLRKIGDTLPVTEEFFEDEVMCAQELEMFLDANVNSIIDNQIVNGDNTGENLKGIVTTVPAFTAVASGITAANISDLVVKAKESITSVGGAKYNVDFVCMNIADINKLMLAKSTQNTYLFDRPDQRLAGVEVIEDNNVTANTLFLGDSRFIRLYEMGGITLSRGLINAQFTSDLSTLKVRKRMAILIRKADETGFKKVTSISAALVTLAT